MQKIHQFFKTSLKQKKKSVKVKLEHLMIHFFILQEIVGNLIEHIGSGFEGEIDAALDILSYLVQDHLLKMAPFAILVKVLYLY